MVLQSISALPPGCDLLILYVTTAARCDVGSIYLFVHDTDPNRPDTFIPLRDIIAKLTVPCVMILDLMYESTMSDVMYLTLTTDESSASVLQWAAAQHTLGLRVEQYDAGQWRFSVPYAAAGLRRTQ